MLQLQEPGSHGEEGGASLALEAEIVKVTDYAEIMKYPLLATPGLVINERLVAAGRVPKLSEVVSYIATAMEG